MVSHTNLFLSRIMHSSIYGRRPRRSMMRPIAHTWSDQIFRVHELHQLKGKLMHQWPSTNHRAKTELHELSPIKLVLSSSPWDTFTYLGQLSDEWGIEGSTIHFASFGNPFIWSCRRSSELTLSLANYQAIRIAPLLTPSKLGPSNVISAPTRPWEKHGAPVNEEPHALCHANKTYISYSASPCGAQLY